MRASANARTHVIYEETAPSAIKSVFLFGKMIWWKNKFVAFFYMVVFVVAGAGAMCVFWYSSNSRSTRMLNHTHSEKKTSNEQVELLRSH